MTTRKAVPTNHDRLRSWLRSPVADVGTALLFVIVVIVSGNPALEALSEGYPDSPAVLVAILAPSAAAIGVRRVNPALAFALIWGAGLVQLAAQVDLFAAQLAIVLIAYSSARHGSRLILWLSAVSVPFAAVLAAAALLSNWSWVIDSIRRRVYISDDYGVFTVWLFAVVLTAWGLPWMVGFIVRTLGASKASDRARSRAEGDAAHARRLAALEAEHTRLARDVHDVVGHSLAVIIAQAESGKYLAGDENPALHAALSSVARTARDSLAEVHEVLIRTAAPGDSERIASPDPEQLIHEVQRAGYTVATRVAGVPLRLPRESDEVAYRVLQEMLTNALRHGAAGSTEVVRSWTSDALLIEVRNLARRRNAQLIEGRGLTGMRARLNQIGGSLDLALAGAEEDLVEFTASARVPAEIGSVDR